MKDRAKIIAEIRKLEDELKMPEAKKLPGMAACAIGSRLQTLRWVLEN